MVTLGQMASWFSGRRRVFVAVFVGWIALVVIGAGGKSDATGWFGVPNLQAAFAAIIGLVLLWGLVFLPFTLGRRHGSVLERRKLSLRATFVVIGIIVALALLFRPDPRDQDPDEEETAQPIVVSEDITLVEPDDDAPMVWLLVIFAAAGGVLLWSRRRSVPELADSGLVEQSTFEAELAPAIDLAASLLVPGGDPRAAVLAAYASLESSLADRGRGREPSETPTEHLARVLASVPLVVGPAVRLGELYALARFSDYEITEADQHSAALELERSRRHLAAVLGSVT